MVEYPVDLLIRRLRVAFEDSNQAKSLLPYVVDIFGECREWN